MFCEQDSRNFTWEEWQDFLYKASSADYPLIDDRCALTIAEANDIRCIGTLGTLLMAKQQKRINQVSSYIQALQDSPLHYSFNWLKDRLPIQLNSEDS